MKENPYITIAKLSISQNLEQLDWQKELVLTKVGIGKLQ